MNGEEQAVMEEVTMVNDEGMVVSIVSSQHGEVICVQARKTAESNTRMAGM